MENFLILFSPYLIGLALCLGISSLIASILENKKKH